MAGQTTRALSTAVKADNNARQAIELVNGADGQLQLHIQNTQLHLRPGEREKWDGKPDYGDVEQDAAWALNEARKYTDQRVGEVMSIVDALIQKVEDIDRRLKALEGNQGTV